MTAVVKRLDGRDASPLAAAMAALPGAPSVVARRTRALDQFERQGLPHRRIEDWKYTDLRASMGEVLPPAATPSEDAIAAAAAIIDAHRIDGVRRLVLVDGAFVPKLSDLTAPEQGLTLRSLKDAANDGDIADDLTQPAQDDPVVALNTAMLTDGVSIEVAPGAALTRPLHLVHVATAQARASILTRSILRIGAGASATLVESFVGPDADAVYQVFDALAVSVGEGARFDHVRVVEDSASAFNISSFFVSAAAKAHVNAFTLTSGAAVSRNQGYITFAGEGARVDFNGVNLLARRQHADTTLFLDHAVPNCDSREGFRAVVDDQAHSVFQGRIIVRPDAQKTDAKMMTRALLLSDDAEADNKPELEIFADDVTCGHGATCGALDEQLLFYLRARGLPEREAQSLLIQAFIGEAIESIADERLRDLVVAAGERWLEARR